MILGIVRHGETDYNKSRRIQGHTDNPLNDVGFIQANTLGMHLKKHDPHWDLLAASPLRRAKQSAETIGYHLDMDISFLDKRFIERDFGPFEGTLINESFPVIMEKDFKRNGYEDDQQLLNRITHAITDLSKQYHHKKLLFVAHSHVIKALLIKALPEKYTFDNYYVLNSSIFYFNIENNHITLLKQYDL